MKKYGRHMTTKRYDLTGQRFGRLVALAEAGKGKSGAYQWECICDCGNKRIAYTAILVHGSAKSCGCKVREDAKKRATKHGYAIVGEYGEYTSWKSMKARCCNDKSPNYYNYGGRGILVCERWLNSFENFLSDMGMKPSSSHTLERDDFNGNYEPSNCRWATPKEQSRNKSNSRWIEHDGRRMILSDWAAEIGARPGSLIRMYEGNKCFSKCIDYYKRKAGLIAQDIKEENAILSQRRSDNDEILESLKR